MKEGIRAEEMKEAVGNFEWFRRKERGNGGSG